VVNLAIEQKMAGRSAVLPSLIVAKKKGNGWGDTHRNGIMREKLFFLGGGGGKVCGMGAAGLNESVSRIYLERKRPGNLSEKGDLYHWPPEKQFNEEWETRHRMGVVGGFLRLLRKRKLSGAISTAALAGPASKK